MHKTHELYSLVSLQIANALGPGIATWFSSLAGFYLPKPDIPSGYLWLYWLNPFRYTWESMVIKMFEGRVCLLFVAVILCDVSQG